MDNSRQLENIESHLEAQNQSISSLHARMQELESTNQILLKNVADLQEQLTRAYIRINQLLEQLDQQRR